MLATVAVPLAPVAPVEVKPWTLVVSGHAPVAAQALFREGRLVLIVASGKASGLYGAPGGAAETAPGGPPGYGGWVPRVFCSPCHRRLPATEISDRRLGFAAFCGPCVRPLVARCLELHGRLPEPGREFYCRGCGNVKLLTERCQPERDGRQRWSCARCRLDRTYAARRARRLVLAAEASAT